jgi:hypothetical protein
MSFKFAIFVLTAVFANRGWAAESIPPELPGPEEEVTLRNAEAVGLAIYKNDHAARIATDAIATLAEPCLAGACAAGSRRSEATASS